jgi:hypothetical protein
MLSLEILVMEASFLLSDLASFRFAVTQFMLSLKNAGFTLIEVLCLSSSLSHATIQPLYNI